MDLRSAYGRIFRFDVPVPDLFVAGSPAGGAIHVRQPGEEPIEGLVEVLDEQNAHLRYTLGRQLRLDRSRRVAEIVGEPFWVRHPRTSRAEPNRRGLCALGRV